MSDTTLTTVTEAEEAADLKRAAATDHAVRQWRADLWPDVPAAIHWANETPISQAGEIVFNIRDNGQVWTYTLV
jgi:hypothetical protein